MVQPFLVPLPRHPDVCSEQQLLSLFLGLPLSPGGRVMKVKGAPSRKVPCLLQEGDTGGKRVEKSLTENLLVEHWIHPMEVLSMLVIWGP
jgi:hypothetical protein